MQILEILKFNNRNNKKKNYFLGIVIGDKSTMHTTKNYVGYIFKIILVYYLVND